MNTILLFSERTQEIGLAFNQVLGLFIVPVLAFLMIYQLKSLFKTSVKKDLYYHRK